jgi:hypothetical protein
MIRRKPPSVTTEEPELEPELEENYDDDLTGFDGEETETDNDSRNYQGTLFRSVDENLRVSSSMPDVGWFRDDYKNRSSSHDNLNSVPLGLPSLRTSSKHGANI